MLFADLVVSGYLSVKFCSFCFFASFKILEVGAVETVEDRLVPKVP